MPITLNGDDFDNILTGGAEIDTLNGLGGSDQLFGLAGDDTLSGGNGDDILDGGKGADALDGGIGNDTYVIDNAKDLITDSAGTADKIIASISVDLAANFGGAIEHATLTGTAALNAFGNVAANILTGNDGANILDGRGGNDTMAGGKGNDTYFVDSQNDKVIEDANGGIGTVNVKSSFFLDFGVNAGQQIENINVIAGSGIVTIGANDLNNIVNGAEAKEFIDGNGGNDTLNGGGGDDVLSGGFGNDFSRFDGNDILNGGDGNDFLQGGTGNDIMTGGAGNDTYFVDSIGDKVIETIADSAVGGIDEVQSFIDFSIAALGNVENILLLNSVTDAADPIRATGNALNNRLDGNFADNLLDGGKGIDTLIGGKGNDTYVLDNLAEGDAAHIQEGANQGTDTVLTSVAIANAIANVENYTFTGTGNWAFTGNGLDNIIIGAAGNDTLIGGDGNDKLNGGLGADALDGGAGNDTYVVDNAKDTVTDSAGTADTVIGNRNIDLVSDFAGAIEHATLTGTAALNVFGNAVANTLTGNDGANILDGRGGNDTMAGGKGNDTYFLDSENDKVIEAVNGGIDAVNVKSSFALDAGVNVGQQIENINVLAGSGDVAIFANDLNNIVNGAEGSEFILGEGGNDTLNGGAGDDFLFGGFENDFSRADGIDILNGGDGDDRLRANDGNDTLNGGDGNDILEGGAGNDSMTGGAGNDVYVVDSLGDKVIETIVDSTVGGIDEVRSFIDFSLAGFGNVENIRLFSGIKATGNALNNRLEGNDADNILDGGKGIDTLVGGKGNDTYMLDNLVEGDAAHVQESANQGTDTVLTGAAIVGAIANVENYTFTGTGSWAFTGNELDNIIIGAAGNDTLSGGIGNDTLNGGLGADALDGGAGNDTYVIDNLKDGIADSAGTADKVIASISVDLAANFGSAIEHATLTGTAAINAVGNAVANTLTGNDGANILDGRGGADIMAGGKGNDIYFIDNTGDRVIETANGDIDTITTSISLDLLDVNFKDQQIENVTVNSLATAVTIKGNDLNNTITGSAGADLLFGNNGNDILTGGDANDTLDGGTGNDTMTGGAGNDLYFVDSLGDKVIETIADSKVGGIDEVRSSINFSIGALVNVENLRLVDAALAGTGNALANTLAGNNLDNFLNGGAGIDILAGGAGNDTYVLDQLAEGDAAHVQEASGQGVDTVLTSAAIANAIANVENYTFTGTGNWAFTGNELDNTIIGGGGADTLSGGGGNDTLSGGTGIDVMAGGAGNDTYIVDNAKDQVVEAAGGGTNDTVQSSISFTLTADVENLELTGKTAINGTGNEVDNRIHGNDAANALNGAGGDDLLFGGLGDDRLTGGEGHDVFDYDHLAERGTGKEVITDFNAAAGDVLDISDLLSDLGVVDDPYAEGVLHLSQSGGNTVVQIDANGGGNSFVTLVTLQGVTLQDDDAHILTGF